MGWLSFLHDRPQNFGMLALKRLIRQASHVSKFKPFCTKRLNFLPSRYSWYFARTSPYLHLPQFFTLLFIQFVKMATAMFYGFMIEILINGLMCWFVCEDLMNLVEAEINDVYAQVFRGKFIIIFLLTDCFMCFDFWLATFAFFLLRIWWFV